MSQLTLLPDLVVLPPTRNGLVYLFTDGYKLKWGFTSRSIRQRSGELRAQVIGYKPGTRNEERDLHAMVKRWNVGGEWFSIPNDPEVLRELQDVVRNLGSDRGDPELLFAVVLANNLPRANLPRAA